MIPMYYCIYVYIGCDVCAASWGRCSRGPGYVRRGFSVFSSFAKRMKDNPPSFARMCVMKEGEKSENERSLKEIKQELNRVLGMNRGQNKWK